jgi:tRNA-dihydrouridine synthase B
MEKLRCARNDANNGREDGGRRCSGLRKDGGGRGAAGASGKAGICAGGDDLCVCGGREGGATGAASAGIRIGRLELESRAMLAPMAGVTDGAFRRICRGLGFRGAIFTEMASVNGLWHGDRKSAVLTKIDGCERPAAVQLFGSDPGMAALIADRLNGAENISFVDINMGCPMPKITKSGAGAALMQNPDLARRLVGAVAKASRYPVSAKIRKGWDSASTCAGTAEFAKMLEDAGASMITVHGRTREQMYGGKADWEAIAAAKAAVAIPVVANGDVFCVGDALRLLAATRCDGVMVGRGAQGNPWLLGQIEKALAAAARPSGDAGLAGVAGLAGDARLAELAGAANPYSAALAAPAASHATATSAAAAALAASHASAAPADLIDPPASATVSAALFAEPGLAERKAAMRAHLLLAVELKGERIGVLDMRKHLAWYVKGMKNATAIKSRIFTLQSAEAILECIDSL